MDIPLSEGCKIMQSQLKKFATEIRIAQLEEFKARGFGHIGGALSITDCLAALYGEIMKYDPKNPQWEDRDRLVMPFPRPALPDFHHHQGSDKHERPSSELSDPVPDRQL